MIIKNTLKQIKNEKIINKNQNHLININNQSFTIILTIILNLNINNIRNKFNFQTIKQKKIKII